MSLGHKSCQVTHPIVNTIRQNFAGTKVWRIQGIVLFSPKFIHQLQKSVECPYILVILDKFTKLSSAKLIYWQTRQTDLLADSPNLVPQIFHHLR